MNIKKGQTSQLIRVFIADTDYADGRGKTGLAHNTSGIKMYYLRETASSATSITPVTMTVGTWASGGFKEVDSTNMPGVYEVGIPDAALATGANSVVLMISGMTGAAVVVKEINLVAYDPQDSVRLGLTALPNAAAAASGGLFVRGTGAGAINQNANGEIDVRIVGMSTAGAAAFLSVATGSADLDSANAQSVAKLIVANVPSASGIATAVWATGTKQITSLGSGAITASSFASGAIDAAALAADAAAEIATKVDESLVVRSGTCQTGAGGSGFVKLDSGASSVDDFYNGCVVYIYSGTGAGQARLMTDYTGSTKTGTLNRAWGTQPDGTSLFKVLVSRENPSNFHNLYIDSGGLVAADVNKWAGYSALTYAGESGDTVPLVSTGAVDGREALLLLGDIAGVLMGKSSVTGAGPFTEVFRSIDDLRDVRTIVVNNTTKQRTASS